MFQLFSIINSINILQCCWIYNHSTELQFRGQRLTLWTGVSGSLQCVAIIIHLSDGKTKQFWHSLKGSENVTDVVRLTWQLFSSFPYILNHIQ